MNHTLGMRFMRETVVKWTVLLGLFLAAYIQYTGCSVDGLPKVMQPHVRSAQAACARSIRYVGNASVTVAKAAQPHVSAATGACARGFGYAGEKLAPLAEKVSSGCRWAEAKASGSFSSVAVPAGLAPRLRPVDQPRGGSAQTVVSGSGTVIRLLPDDIVGSRHQKFILQLASGQTLQIAHNIDFAARIESLRVGDLVSYCGEYEANTKGGVVHWTHHDPQGQHAAGWLKHNGHTYQ